MKSKEQVKNRILKQFPEIKFEFEFEFMGEWQLSFSSKSVVMSLSIDISIVSLQYDFFSIKLGAYPDAIGDMEAKNISFEEVELLLIDFLIVVFDYANKNSIKIR